MPELAPYVTDTVTWREHVPVYHQLYVDHDPVLLLARVEGRLVGYALGYTMPVAGTWLADTWETGARIGEVETLAVLPDYRGRGIGSELLDLLHAALREQGAEDFILGALAGNADAIRLYERHGYRPTWLYLSRFARRSDLNPEGPTGDVSADRGGSSP